MTTATKRKKIQEFIINADDKKVEAIYAMVEDKAPRELAVPSDKNAKLQLMKLASTDPLFLEDLVEIKSDFEFIDK